MVTRESTGSDLTWVADVLHEEQLELADEKRAKHYGRREFSTGTRIVLWFLRIYVVLMMVIIVVQLYLGVHQ